MNETTREVARCSGFDVADEHGQMAMRGAFNYDGGGQGFGYSIDATFVLGFMRVFRVETLQAVNGRYCWVTHTHDNILRVEPVLPQDGEAFDVAAWAATVRRGRSQGKEG